MVSDIVFSGPPPTEQGLKRAYHWLANATIKTSESKDHNQSKYGYGLLIQENKPFGSGVGCLSARKRGLFPIWHTAANLL